jgi:hypothetical protein
MTIALAVQIGVKIDDFQEWTLTRHRSQALMIIV